ncbi:hypothetical protein RHOER0001_3898 [Rhodococcus erythropolis SK121]|nr:hypothetical protein RHOER0001_3898 [Rhodococcus erythropolis SK121]
MDPSSTTMTSEAPALCALSIDAKSVASALKAGMTTANSAFDCVVGSK